MKSKILISLIMSMTYAANVEMYDQPQHGRLIRLADVKQLSIIDEYIQVQDMQTKVIGFVSKKEYERAIQAQLGFSNSSNMSHSASEEALKQKIELIKQSVKNRQATLNQWIKQPSLPKAG